MSELRRRVRTPLCAVLIALFSVDQVYSHFYPNEGDGITGAVVSKTDGAEQNLVLEEGGN